MSDSAEYWFHEDDNYSKAAAEQQNADSGYGPEKYKVRPFVDAAELLKWKARCASLTAEVVALRESIRSRRVGALAKHYERKYWNHANRIKAEREAEIIKDAAGAEGG